jgi:hypothetical protein
VAVRGGGQVQEPGQEGGDQRNEGHALPLQDRQHELAGHRRPGPAPRCGGPAGSGSRRTVRPRGRRGGGAASGRGRASPGWRRWPGRGGEGPAWTGPRPGGGRWSRTCGRWPGSARRRAAGRGRLRRRASSRRAQPGPPPRPAGRPPPGSPPLAARQARVEQQDGTPRAMRAWSISSRGAWVASRAPGAAPVQARGAGATHGGRVRSASAGVAQRLPLPDQGRAVGRFSGGGEDGERHGLGAQAMPRANRAPKRNRRRAVPPSAGFSARPRSSRTRRNSPAAMGAVASGRSAQAVSRSRHHQEQGHGVRTPRRRAYSATRAPAPEAHRQRPLPGGGVGLDVPDVVDHQDGGGQGAHGHGGDPGQRGDVPRLDEGGAAHRDEAEEAKTAMSPRPL